MAEECECNLRTRLVGDGCEHCNPKRTIDFLKAEIDDLRSEVERLRVTDAERATLMRNLTHRSGQWLMHISSEDQRIISNLLARTASLT